jgi:glycine dehydrogenase subunit 1
LLNARRAHYACAELLAGGVVDKRFKSPFFNEFTVKVKGGAAEELLEYLLGRNIVGGLHLGRFYPEYEDCILVAVTETRGKRDIDSLAAEVKSWR